MMIKYDNSLYTTIAPEIEFGADYGEDAVEQIQNHIDEENYWVNGFVDVDTEQIRELIKWEE